MHDNPGCITWEKVSVFVEIILQLTHLVQRIRKFIWDVIALVSCRTPDIPCNSHSLYCGPRWAVAFQDSSFQDSGQPWPTFWKCQKNGGSVTPLHGALEVHGPANQFIRSPRLPGPSQPGRGIGYMGNFHAMSFFFLASSLSICPFEPLPCWLCKCF